jgi:hypothetical protein
MCEVLVMDKVDKKIKEGEDLKEKNRNRKKRWVMPRILREMDLEIRAAFCGPGLRAKIVRDPPFCIIAYS